MRHIVLLGLFWLVATSPAAALEILGSGSTFAYPVLTKWSEAYEKTSGVHIGFVANSWARTEQPYARHQDQSASA